MAPLPSTLTTDGYSLKMHMVSSSWSGSLNSHWNLITPRRTVGMTKNSIVKIVSSIIFSKKNTVVRQIFTSCCDIPSRNEAVVIELEKRYRGSRGIVLPSANRVESLERHHVTILRCFRIVTLKLLKERKKERLAHYSQVSLQN